MPENKEIRVLVVCSGNAVNFHFQKHQAFIYDQINAVKKVNPEIQFDTFFIKGKGIRGYVKNLSALKKHIKQHSFHLIHAHVGHVGFLCILQNLLPVIITYHGSDINRPVMNIISSIAGLFAKRVIFISEELAHKILIKRTKITSVIPCGVDLNIFYPVDISEARNKFGWQMKKRYILFPSAFNVPVKNYPLAKKAISLLVDKPEVIELKQKTREEVNLILNASDVVLLTSHSEGSPQIIKEAMACNTPIVSVDVGNVKEVTTGTEGTFICRHDAEEIAAKINLAFEFNRKTNGREKIQHLDNKIIAKKIFEVYKSTIQ